MSRLPSATARCRIASFAHTGQRAVLICSCALLITGAPLVSALAAEPAAVRPQPAAARSDGAAWASLSVAQKTALAPLQRDWPTIESSSRDKWLEVASRFPTMPAAERQRVQDRMAEWARLTPTQRTQARLQFQEARQVSPLDRQAKWEAYQALPEEQRRELADRAKPVAGKAAASALANANSEPVTDSKRNIVPTQRSAAARPVTPTMVQANPGATTTLISAPPSAPVHNQPGLPKIAATEGFVNPSTLLPKRGPQGAAGQPASASQPAAQR